MTTEQLADRMSNEEASAFAQKLEAFERSLTPKERRLFQEMLLSFSLLQAEDTGEAVLWAGDAE